MAVATPTSTISPAARGKSAAIDADECIQWLDSKDPSSVIYVSFGSIARTDPKQLIELGLGLEASAHPFIWMVKNAELYGDTAREFFPRFEISLRYKVLARARGTHRRPWHGHQGVDTVNADPVARHGRWLRDALRVNSIMEVVATRLPMVTWPHSVDQLLNQKMAVEVLGIGVGVGLDESVTEGHCGGEGGGGEGNREHT
ncbi:hypothetical protein OsJ_20560 [Oryza sativa Japonica Group]|uniref:Uncharacterized protein n=1 Tax=Oryza sativa subsp. japonica TaxID=39947 RepID=B9FS55_ORYSJ|nr:hypothetical protein OsJ_20560 [Oryza sativa Japonica Group]